MNRIASGLVKLSHKTKATSAKSIRFEVDKLAKFCDGSCLCSLGDTSVLVTTVSEHSNAGSRAEKHVPLTVNYRQKAAAAGRIPLNYLRREMGNTEREILTGRMIDRSIRPGFPYGYNYDTQVVCNLMAIDGLNDADIPAINGASASLAISDIPWYGPIGAVRLGLIDGVPVINPTRKEQEHSSVDIVLAATVLGNILMMDANCSKPTSSNDIVRCIKIGLVECMNITKDIMNLQRAHGKTKRTLELEHLPSDELKKIVLNFAQEKLKLILTDYTLDKLTRDRAIRKVFDEMIEQSGDSINVSSATWMFAYSAIIRQVYEEVLKSTSTRLDGRKFEELRKIDCQVDLYKPLHGSAIFQRGLTQVFCSATLDSPDAAYRLDPISTLISGVKEKNFMLHYEFPPFATNEVGKIATGRRDIGHGALAEKAIRPILPDNNELTLRLACEVLESNGSSSMASVCAGSLSLMDAGVQISEHVAGVAMGLLVDSSDRQISDVIKKKEKNYLLTDIMGFEDYCGDMDFKIAGTKKAVTAFQLDVKPTHGLPPSIIFKALHDSQAARIKIINLMSKAIKEPRQEKKPNHPVMKSVHIPAHKRSKLIGFGGANLKKLTALTGVRVSAFTSESQDEEELTYDNTIGAKIRDNFVLFAPNQNAMTEAEEFIKNILEADDKEPELEFNAIYNATVDEIRPNGIMVRLYPEMKPTLLPLSQLDVKVISHPSVLNLQVGQQIQVKYFGRDPVSGNMRLSRKSLLMTSTPRDMTGVP